MKTSTNKPKKSQVPASQQAARSTLSQATKPTTEEIAKRAYEIYLEKGCQQGQCEENWKQAEQELKKLFSQKFGHACIWAGTKLHRYFQIESHGVGNVTPASKVEIARKKQRFQPTNKDNASFYRLLAVASNVR